MIIVINSQSLISPDRNAESIVSSTRLQIWSMSRIYNVKKKDAIVSRVIILKDWEPYIVLGTRKKGWLIYVTHHVRTLDVVCAPTPNTGIIVLGVFSIFSHTIRSHPRSAPRAKRSWSATISTIISIDSSTINPSLLLIAIARSAVESIIIVL